MNFDWVKVRRSRRTRYVVDLVTGSDLQTRVAAAFLGSTRLGRVQKSESLLIANLYLACLAGFLGEEGLAVEGVVNTEDSYLKTSQTRLLEISPGKTVVVPSEATILLSARGKPELIVGVSHDPFHKTLLLDLYARRGADQYLSRWEEYALRHAYLKGQAFYASGEFVRIDPPVDWDSVFLSAQARDQIERMVVEFPAQAALFRRHGLPAKRGVILAGPPGTGKTMICRALCNRLDCTFIWITARHAGQSSFVLADIWRLARHLAPTVILLEDLDLYAEDRESAAGNNLLGELMNQMDGADSNDGILTIATTNRLDMVESALRNRPGRFDRAIHINSLDEVGRHELIAGYLSTMQADPGLLDKLLSHTEGFTGAQVVDLIKTIVEFASLDNGMNSAGSLQIRESAVQAALDEILPHRAKPSKVGFAPQEAGADCLA